MTLKQPLKYPFRVLRGMARLRTQKKRNNKVIFRHEGGIAIKQPPFSYGDLLRPTKLNMIDLCYTYAKRGDKEPLLRHVIFQLYQQSILDKQKSIIDIGCWLGDNALVWSQLLENNAQVYAIDPSAENIAFGQQLAEINQCDNISWFQEACSDKEGIQLYYQGRLNHAEFNEHGLGKPSPKTSTTIDCLIGEENFDNIGLFHLDVEGFEQKVLNGSLSLLEKSRTAILFEQHIAQEDTRAICEFLGKFNYEIFMINEVMPKVYLDCRNFLALPKEQKFDGILEVNQPHGSADGIWYAALGGALLRVEV